MTNPRSNLARQKIRQVRRAMWRSWRVVWSIATVAVGATIVGLMADYERNIRDTGQRAGLAADGAAQGLRLAIHGVEAELANVALMLSSPMPGVSLSARLAREAGRAGVGHVVVMLNPLGRIIATSDPARLAVGADYGTHELFRIHTRTTAAASYLGPPLAGLGLPVSVAVRGADGRLLGVAAALVDGREMAALFPASWWSGQNVRIGVHFNGAGVAVAPAPPGWEGPLTFAMPSVAGGIWRAAWGPQGEPHVIAARAVAATPLVVEAAIPEAAALAGFYRGLVLWGGIGLAAVIALLIGARIHLRQLNRTLLQAALIGRKNEDLKRSNAVKTEFLGHMSHELRTPLNAVIGFAEALLAGLHGDLAGKQRQYVHDISVSGRHLLGLVNDLLDLSVIDSGVMRLNETLVDVQAVIGDGVKMVQHFATESRLTLTAEVSPRLPRAWMDARKLQQILLNLMGNAIKYTPRGGAVMVQAHEEAGSGDLLIAVHDTGRGIAPKDIPLVLSPFGRVESVSSRTQEGAGIGLPLTKRLVELHGGTLTIESAEGQGTIAQVRFPRDRLLRYEPDAAMPT